MVPGGQRVLSAVNQSAMRLVRVIGNWAPVDAKRLALNLRPASVLWHIPEHEIAFVHIPKVATTSVRATLATFVAGRDNAPDAEDGERLVAEAIDKYARHLYPSEIRRLGRECFTFAFVRNPLDRLVSAYSSKGGFRKHKIARDTPFPEFVRKVASIPDHRADRHIRSQYRFIADRQGIAVEQVRRFERLESEWAELMDRFGFPLLPKRNTSVRGPYEESYTPSLARLAADRYRRDIELFGYEAAIAHLV